MEAMYIIFNLGMSPDFAPVDIDNLSFPAEFLLDYIRWGTPGREKRGGGGEACRHACTSACVGKIEKCVQACVHERMRWKN